MTARAKDVTSVTKSQRPRTRGPADAEIEEFVTAVLTASRVLVGVTARSLADVEQSVTLPQFRMLVVLGQDHETNLNGLADSLGVSPSTALRMIDRLLAAGLVTREENPADRREVVLGLSADGSQLIDTVTARRRTEIRSIVTAMPKARRAELIAALHAFADAAGEPQPADQTALG